ncbi:MAG: hypothetical protein K2N17_00275, partial [Clostridia bacterium]|nr:hypothetical protein [Clostridia bacterium]
MADNENKNEGKVSGFFKNLGKKFDNATYEMRLQSDFGKSHKKYAIYSSTSILLASPEIAVAAHLD